MLRIAICDDTPLYAGELAAQLYEIAEEMSVEIVVDTFRSYGALGQAHEAKPFEVIFLEIALRDLLVLCYAEQADLLFFVDEAAASELCSRFTARRLLTVTDSIDRAVTALAANGNVRLMLFQLAATLTH